MLLCTSKGIRIQALPEELKKQLYITLICLVLQSGNQTTEEIKQEKMYNSEKKNCVENLWAG